MLIKACLNGSRAPGVHPALPVTPAALASAAAGAVSAGAGAIHFHVRDAQGRESLAPDDVARTLMAVRAAVPGTAIGVSTGAWIVSDPTERLALVAAWPQWPDFAAVNFHEPGAVALAEYLLSRGIGVEAGVRDAGAARVWVNSGLAARCLRVMFEPPAAVLEEALSAVDGIEAVLTGAAASCPRLLHGLDATVWALIDDAARRGYDTRVGLEDTLRLPDGGVAPSNAALVAEAWRRVSQRGVGWGRGRRR